MTWSKRMVLLMIADSLGIFFIGALGSTVILFGELNLTYLRVWVQLALLFIPVQIIINYFLGLYSRIWRYASVSELLNVLGAATAGAAVVFLTLGYRTGYQIVIFRTVPLYWLLTTSVLGGVRFAIRIRREIVRERKVLGERTLIVGAGNAGVQLLKELHGHPELGLLPVGFIDDDASKHGLSISNVPVLGGRNKLTSVIEELHISRLILAIPDAKADVVRDIVTCCAALAVQVLTVPGLYELVNGNVSTSRIRDVQIEDLLHREEIKVDLPLIGSYLYEQVVLVTGAGGSIGSELCRQVMEYKPKLLILLGHGENSIYNIHRELTSRGSDVPIVPVIADVKDEERMEQVFAKYLPQVVFHAAAHKHVPLMESNPAEAVKNNVQGTYTVAKLSSEFAVGRFVLISTDKAVNPTSVMGATKRVAELVLQLFVNTGSTKYMAVRFGNVLGSRGSVIPLFKEQIAKGGPVTVTHPDMVRYFMTIPEAVSLVLQTGALGQGGEVFVLDMGEPVKILDMAKDLITLSGMRPDFDIKIEFTGLRPGEKLFEELLTHSEGTSSTVHNKIFVAVQARIEPRAVLDLIATLNGIVTSPSIQPSQVLDAVKLVDTHVDEVAAARSTGVLS